MIFGHSDTISLIWKSLKITSESVKMAKNCNDGALARAYEIRKIQKVSEMKDMMPLSILCTHMSRIEVTCWFYSPKLLKKCQNCDFLGTPFWHVLEVLFGGRNFKSAKQGQSVQKSRKSGFRVYSLRIRRKFRRTTSDPQKNVQTLFRGRKSIFLNPLFWH